MSSYLRLTGCFVFVRSFGGSCERTLAHASVYAKSFVSNTSWLIFCILFKLQKLCCCFFLLYLVLVRSLYGKNYYDIGRAAFCLITKGLFLLLRHASGFDFVFLQFHDYIFQCAIKTVIKAERRYVEKWKTSMQLEEINYGGILTCKYE